MLKKAYKTYRFESKNVLTLSTFCTLDSMVARVTSIEARSVNVMTLFFSQTPPALFSAVLTKRPITAHFLRNNFHLTAYR